MSLLWVMAGGALGSGARYLLATRVTQFEWFAKFPMGTLTVNLVGCFLIGVLYSTLPAEHPSRLFLMVGCLGGFTTFSSFGLETMTLINEGRMMHAALYVLLSNVGGVLLALLGSRLT